MNEDRDIRHVMVNHPNPGFPSNRVSNTKYHWWSFVFVNLFEQLIQPMNAYYVIEACLELFPVITAYNPLTTWIPVIFIFTLTAIREAVEDIRRYKTDRKANQHLVRVLKGDLLVEVKSEDLQVGDIVYIEENEEIPCDLVLLYSSGNNGDCYIRTSNIDGESNLKLRKINPSLYSHFRSSSRDELQRKLNSTSLEIFCGPPDSYIYRFDAHLRLNDSIDISLSAQNLLLQVTQLQFTKFA